MMNSPTILVVLICAVMDLCVAAYFWRLRSAEKMPTLLAKMAELPSEVRKKKLQAAALIFLISAVWLLGVAIWFWSRSKA